jgi:hypothetical protein
MARLVFGQLDILLLQKEPAPVWQDENITQAKYRELLLQKVFPAIMSKWPRGEWARPNVIIRVQQDGAPSHINPQDPALLQGLQQLGIHNKVLLYTQPSNSPGTNINDLGFFCALQSEYYKMTPGNAGQIIQRLRAESCRIRCTHRTYPLKKSVSHFFILFKPACTLEFNCKNCLWISTLELVCFCSDKQKHF